MKTKQRDALNNIGLPQLTNYCSIYDLSKREVAKIRETILYFDSFYEVTPKDNDTRKEVVNIINLWCDAFRCSSLIIE